MNFDLEFVKQAFGALGNVLTVLKQAKDLLPEGGKKVEVAKAIENAEKELKNAEAESARALGYQLCRNHWPAEIMLSKDNLNWKCPVCGNEIKYKKQENPLKNNNLL